VAQQQVIFAAMLPLLLGTTFLIMAVIAHRYGNGAQRAAEAEVVKQGFTAGVLARNGVRFEESGVETLLLVGIALGLATLASLNLAGSDTGRILSWIFQPMLLVAGGGITAGQVFTVRYIEAAFKKSDDATLQRINIRAFVDAAKSAFPFWLGYLVLARFVLVTVGSLFVIILLAVP
jgi:hypothetical protein